VEQWQRHRPRLPFTYSSYAYGINDVGQVVGEISGSFVPEPSTWALMPLGFAGLGYAGYRRARAVHATLAA
jgi:hypothetical protein